VTAPAQQLALFGSEEAVVVRRSARARRLGLRVFPHGVVEVVAPMRAGKRSIEEFIRSNAAWIAKTRDHFQALHGGAGFVPPAEIRLAALAECWQVEYVRGTGLLRAVAQQGGGRLVVTGPEDAQWRRQRLRAWLMAHARARLLPWLATVSAEVGLGYTRATVRRQRSRWGSCSAGGALSLNCALLFLEPVLVRHLFVHELAHTRHLNHSRAYWRLVARLDPEYESLDARLRAAWCTVPAWVSYDPPYES
jgi:predicted metal-dependent hydrolase